MYEAEQEGRIIHRLGVQGLFPSTFGSGGFVVSRDTKASSGIYTIHTTLSGVKFNLY